MLRLPHELDHKLHCHTMTMYPSNPIRALTYYSGGRSGVEGSSVKCKGLKHCLKKPQARNPASRRRSSNNKHIARPQLSEGQ